MERSSCVAPGTKAVRQAPVKPEIRGEKNTVINECGRCLHGQAREAQRVAWALNRKMARERNGVLGGRVGVGWGGGGESRSGERKQKWLTHEPWGWGAE